MNKKNTNLMTKEYGFVVLHYLTFDMTKKCLETLLNLYSEFNIHIVCVDNCSMNDSFFKLESNFKDNKKIDFIRNNKNLGFAQGNNIGYLYLKANYSCDYIIIINNDVLFEDKNSLIKIDEIYNKEKFSVLGPDIYNPKTNVHQNPSYNYNIKRLYGRTITDIKARNNELKQNYSHFFCFYITDKFLKFRHKYFHWVRKIFPKKNVPPADMKLDSIDNQMENVVLHGACYIFSKEFINKRKFAFNPNTFLYFEEDILHYECQLENLKMIYTPEIKVQHLEDVSTDLAFKKQYKKDKMITKELINSTNVYISIYEQKQNKEKNDNL
jgi:GT2 family glycosyltransferase